MIEKDKMNDRTELSIEDYLKLIDRVDVADWSQEDRSGLALSDESMFPLTYVASINTEHGEIKLKIGLKNDRQRFYSSLHLEGYLYKGEVLFNQINQDWVYRLDIRDNDKTKGDPRLKEKYKEIRTKIEQHKRDSETSDVSQVLDYLKRQ